MSHMYIGNSLPTELVSKSINYKNQCSKSVVMEKCQDKRSKRSTDQISGIDIYVVKIKSSFFYFKCDLLFKKIQDELEES